MSDEGAPPAIPEESASMEQVEPTSQDMEIEEEEPQEEVEEDNSPPTDDAIEKSRIQKESFMEIFKIAPKIKDILPDLREFMSHPDVIEWDRREIQQLVELKIQDEKAKKKAEKAAKSVEQAVEKPPGQALVDVIRSATGIELAGILSKLPKFQKQLNPSNPSTSSSPLQPHLAQMGAPAAAQPRRGPIMIPVISGDTPLDLNSDIPPQSDVMIPFELPPNYGSHPSLIPIAVVKLGNTQIKSIRRGKAGFSTPHPNDIPPELRHAKPDLVAPIPEELRNQLGKKKEVPAIPNELLPPDQQVYEPPPFVEVKPSMRKTLFLAGARAGKRSDRIKPEEKKTGKNKRKKQNSDPADSENEPNHANRPNNAKKPRGGILSGMNALPQGLNKNSPIAVKRYHARQLAKDTGMSLEEAMAEIEEQCNEFGEADTPLAKEHDEEAMKLIKKHGDEMWNQRYNYTPADHSKGIPGVDRPPTGLPPRKEMEPVPGVDRPPGGGRREDRELIPGVDRPPGGGRRDPIPGFDRPPGGFGGRGGGGAAEKRRARGGVKEREKKKRREEFAYRQSDRGGRGGRGRGGGRGYGGDRGYDGYDEHGGRDYGRPYDDYDPRDRRHDPYDDYGAHHDQYGAEARYDDRGGYGEGGGGYEDYYGRQDAGGYDDYRHHYAEGGYGQEGGAEHTGYDHYGAGPADAGAAAAATEDYYQSHQGQDTYYQEDGGQYYNHYYGTGVEEPSTSEAPEPLPPPPAPPAMSEYHAKFAPPGRAPI